MPRSGVDPRFRRERTEEDPVFTYDDRDRGFARFVAHKEDKERERFTGDAWKSYKRWKDWQKSRDTSKDKWKPQGEFKSEVEDFQYQFYQ